MGIGIGPFELIILAGCPLTLLLVVVVALAIAGKRRNAANLINCPGCGNGVSPHAAACPHCGRTR